MLVQARPTLRFSNIIPRPDRFGNSPEQKR